MANSGESGGAGDLRRDPLLVSVCIAVVTMPMEISGLWFPSTLVNVSRLAMLAAMIVVGLRLVRRVPVVLPAARWLPLVVGVVLAVDVASALAFGWPGAAREVVSAAYQGAFAICLVAALTDRRRIVVVALCVVAAGFAEAALILAQQAGDFYLTQVRDMAGRRNGTFVDPNIAARFLLVALCVALVGAGRAAGGRLRLLAPIAAVMTAAIVLTYSRTAWLLLVVLVLAGLVAGWRDRRIGVVAATILVVFGVSLLAVPHALDRARDLPAAQDPTAAAGTTLVAWMPNPPTPAPGTADATPASPIDRVIDVLPLDPVRRYLAKAGVAMFLDHPVIGVGLGGYAPQLQGRYAAYIDPEYHYRQIVLPHTDLIRIAAEEGLVGLLAFALLVLAVVLAIRRAWIGATPFGRSTVVAASLAVGIVFLTSQTEGRLLPDPYLWTALGVIAALPASRRSARAGL